MKVVSVLVLFAACAVAYSQVLPPFGHPGVGPVGPGLLPPFLPPIIPPPFFGGLFPPFLPFFRPFFGLRRFGMLGMGLPFFGKRDTSAQVQPEQAQKIEITKSDVEEMHKAIRAAEATLEEMKKAAIEAEKIATEKVAKSVETETVKAEEEVKKVAARATEVVGQQEVKKVVDEPSKVVVEKAAEQQGSIFPTSLEMQEQEQKKVAEKSVVQTEVKKVEQ